MWELYEEKNIGENTLQEANEFFGEGGYKCQFCQNNFQLGDVEVILQNSEKQTYATCCRPCTEQKIAE